MPSDPIQHLRSLQSAAQIERPWRYDAASQCIFDADDTPVCDAISRVEGRYIVALVNAAPALLAVAEALAKHKTTAEEYMDMSDKQKTTMRGRRLGSQAEAEYHAALAALDKLDEVKP